MGSRQNLYGFLLLLLVLTNARVCFADNFLNKIVTVEANQKPVSEVLKSVGDQGGFYFSYNSNIIKHDSLVTVYTYRKTVREVLDILFQGRFEYKEKNNYIIIQVAEYWYATGYIVDGTTGDKIINASVYEKQQMVSTLTNEQGYFRLRLKDKDVPAVLNVSRSWYADTSLIIRAASSSELKVNITPKNFVLDTVVVTQYSAIEKNWWSRLLVSSRQRMQSANINKFFVDMPYQTSFTPGLSTHGKMNSQVVNRVSFNVLGGYTAGTHGFELGGLFNIVRRDVKYVQIAGLFNNVGGEVDGVQISGLFNNVLDTVDACQIAGLSNSVKGSARGVQIAGLSNYSNHEAKGVQTAGVANVSGLSMKGMQIAGVANMVRRTMNGVQLAGVVNVAQHVNGAQIAGVVNITENLNGLQFGVINIADSSSGYSIGLITLVRKGYHKISFSTNEVVNTNVSLKLGTNKLYSIYFAGTNLGTAKAFTFGLGYGGEIPIWKGISLNPEITTQHMYLGDWQHTNLLSKFYLHLNIRVNKYLAFYAGPTLNHYYQEQSTHNEGYITNIPGDRYKPSVYSNTNSTWIGWNAGITLF